MTTVQGILREGGKVVVVVGPGATRVVQIIPKDRRLVTINRGLTGGSATEYFAQVTLSAGQVTAKAVALSAVPAIPERVSFTVQGAPEQFYGDDFTINGSELSWGGLALDGILEAGDKVKIRFLV